MEERNGQCRHISHSLFSKNWNPYERPTQITVWLGDLNYRLQGIDSLPARNLIRKNLHKVSLKKLIFIIFNKIIINLINLIIYIYINEY